MTEKWNEIGGNGQKEIQIEGERVWEKRWHWQQT